MFKDHYTILLFPSKTSKVKKFRLSQFTIRSLFFSIVTVMIALGLIVFDYVNIKLESFELARLKEDTRRQKTHIQSFVDKIGSLESQLARLKQFDTKLRIIANIEKPKDADQTLGLGGSLDGNKRSINIFNEKQDRLIKRMHSDLEQLKVEASLQEHSLQELHEFLQDQKSLLASTPSIWPTRGWVTSGFGYRKSPFTGLREFHKGLDIATRLNTPVIAPADGIVTFVGREGGFGKLIVINHGYGIVTRYAHLSKTFIKRGQRVKRGVKIGGVGNTGRSTGTHLHYEIRVGGVPVNPRNYLLN
ncbi:MAG: peptidoglycan DD-metalloendopeptidase family protein [Thermodesulfobacteriota bacterium]|nr:peptidoglycan DD-metalloendopeptidase family protein [Thermodesulfobacteriota bacterium]